MDEPAGAHPGQQRPPRPLDHEFRVASQRVNGANAVSFNYDADSLLTGAGALTMARNAGNGLLDTTTLGAISDDRDYSLFGELSAYAATGAQQNLLQVTYERDQLGRITKQTESIAGGAAVEIYYEYDLAGRLWRVCVDAACTTVRSEYLYDANGNRIAGSFDRHSGTVVSATYDDQDRLASYETTLGGAASFAYGANGEIESKTAGSDVTRYSYDVLGNLKEVVLHDGEPNEQSITYVVDGRNRRIGKKVNGTLIQGFLYDGQWRIVAELDGSNTVVSRFVYGERPNVPEYLLRGGVAYRILTDHLGSPRLVVNAADGTIAQRMDYDAFGNVLVDTNPGFQPFGFAGGLYDPDTGFVRFGARDYDPQIGRWTAKDPIGFGGGDPNLYGYVLHDPVNAVDPRGLDIWIEGRGPGENPFHVSINVGNPNDPSHIFSVSFGLAATEYPFILGYAYLDQVHGGPILEYMKTTPAQDLAAIDLLWNDLDNYWNLYAPLIGDTCISYTRNRFNLFQQMFGGRK